jgi:hypothetical protein
MLQIRQRLSDLPTFVLLFALYVTITHTLYSFSYLANVPPVSTF